jgi:hypothetical protein
MPNHCSVTRRSNLTIVCLGKLILVFSYQTVIAFEDRPNPFVYHENIWGVTTGKHLNTLDGGSKKAKQARLSAEEFKAALAAVLKKYNLLES